MSKLINIQRNMVWLSATELDKLMNQIEEAENIRRL
jgi:hypothetical protein